MTCDICGQPLPTRRPGTRGRVPQRHKGACQAEHQRRYYAKWKSGEILCRPYGVRDPQRWGDEPSSVIATRLRQAEAHVKATKPFQIDAWQQRWRVETAE